MKFHDGPSGRRKQRAEEQSRHEIVLFRARATEVLHSFGGGADDAGGWAWRSYPKSRVVSFLNYLYLELSALYFVLGLLVEWNLSRFARQQSTKYKAQSTK